jgi:hypothetical protein
MVRNVDTELNKPVCTQLDKVQIATGVGFKEVTPALEA